MPELSERQAEVLRELSSGATTRGEVADALDVTKSTVSDHFTALRNKGYALNKERDGNQVTFTLGDAPDDPVETPDADDETDALPDLSDTPVADADPDVSDLTDAERRLARELQTGRSLDELTDTLEDRPGVITERLRDLRRRGWQVYIDESAEHIAIEGDSTLRSSEHIGTRTRKANKWWEQRHNQLVREYKGLSDVPSAVDADADPDTEDWVLHLTDIHAGDFVRQDDGTVVYEPELIPDVIDYATRRSLHLADVHGADYDTAYILPGGDWVTGEGVYEGQLENDDVEAFMDEQIDMLHDPTLRLIEAYAERFENVVVVCQVGNHGKSRASGTSKQNNGDLIAYKNIRNTISTIQDKYGDLQNVAMKIGEARPYRNFQMRDGKVTGHLRHGQDRDPQASTSARLKEWMSTLLDHDFDLAYLGHHHVTGMIPWDGPPIVATGSPKPSGEFVERLGTGVPSRYQSIASCHGVSDAGMTGFYPIDDRAFDRRE